MLDPSYIAIKCIIVFLHRRFWKLWGVAVLRVHPNRRWLAIKGELDFLFLFSSKGTDNANLFLGTFNRTTLFSHSILFSITRTSVPGRNTINRRQLQWCKHHYKPLFAKMYNPITHQTIELENCSNPLRIQQVV